MTFLSGQPMELSLDNEMFFFTVDDMETSVGPYQFNSETWAD
ncbi:hypothetical protein N9O24_00420 [bacterium]|nr:hypothetical protein [bacterium]